MQRTKRRMIVIAVVVCGFAVGMAGLLNYFKYRATSNRIVTERLVVTGRTIENVVHFALDLGLPFSDIATLPATLQRERNTDDLILGIDIFGDGGRLLYSTDGMRAGRSVPPGWVQAALASRGGEWLVDEPGASAAGMALKNSFGVVIGHLAVRFSHETVADETRAVALELATNTAVVFVLSSLVASLALVSVMQRLGRDVAEAEAALDQAHPGQVPTALLRGGPFQRVLLRFLQTTEDVRHEIGQAQAALEREGRP